MSLDYQKGSAEHNRSYPFQAEKLALSESCRDREMKMHQIETEKEEIFEDNQRIATMLATSEGDKKEVGSILERLSEERRNFQRQCRQFKEKGKVRSLQEAAVATV